MSSLKLNSLFISSSDDFTVLHVSILIASVGFVNTPFSTNVSKKSFVSTAYRLPSHKAHSSQLLANGYLLLPLLQVATALKEPALLQDLVWGHAPLEAGPTAVVVMLCLFGRSGSRVGLLGLVSPDHLFHVADHR